MVAFFLVVATLNLCVGYAFGAWVLPPAELGLAPPKWFRRRPAPIGEPVLTRPVQEPAASKQVAAKPAAGSPAQVKPAGAEAPAAQQPPVAAPQATTRGAALASLSDFREKLAEAGMALRQSQGDASSFDACATRLQQANHEYLEHAEDTIGKLEQLGASGDARAGQARDAVARGAEEVARLSGEVDQLLEAGLDEQSREKLLGCSEQIEQAAEKAEQSVALARQHESVDALFDHLEALLAEATEDRPAITAAVVVDPIAGAGADESALAAITATVEEMLVECLGAGQHFVPGVPYLAVLEGDDFPAAATRLEQLRRRVESTTFRHGDAEIRATITCAITEATQDADRDAVQKRIEESLVEANRLGRNRTIHHDGAFPTAVPQDSAPVEQRVVALA